MRARFRSRSVIPVLAFVLLATAEATQTGAASSAAVPGVPPAKMFASTGHQQSYGVPANVMLVETDLQGGSGGGGSVGMPLGGYLPVSGGTKLYVEVGSSGSYEGGPTFGAGGAAGAFAPCPNADADGRCGGAFAGSGGGASDIRTCSESVSRCPAGGSSLGSRLIVAGGGAGQGGDGFGPGFYCTELPSGGTGRNPQALPGGTPSQGPVPVRIASGLVIPGEPSDHSYGGPIKDITPSQGGSVKPGAGGAMSKCIAYEVNNGSVIGSIFDGSITGAAGNGANGGAGASSSSFPAEGASGYLPGAGGGGGGGFAGGGGGSSGEPCTYDVNGGPCNDPSSAQGGGGGSSFLSNEAKGGFIEEGAAAAPFITITPIVELDSPRNGAVYRHGQVVDARWACGRYQGTSCTATEPSGNPISTTPGKHRFTVNVSPDPTHVNVPVTVTYTVRS